MALRPIIRNITSEINSDTSLKYEPYTTILDDIYVNPITTFTRASTEWFINSPSDLLDDVTDDVYVIPGGYWNDTNWQSTSSEEGIRLGPAVTNYCEDSRDFEGVGWIGTAAVVKDQIGIDGVVNTASTITDDDDINFKKLTFTTNISANTDTHIISLFIEKDEDETRFPLMQLELVGDSVRHQDIMVNTKTGAFVESVYIDGSFSVAAMGLFWKITVSVQNNSTNTILKLHIFPAGGLELGIYNATATGSAVFDQLDIRLNQSYMDPPILTDGATNTRAATLLTAPTAGTLPANDFSIALLVIPDVAGQTGVNIFGSYNDADEAFLIGVTATTIFVTKEIGGVEHTATATYSHVADTEVTVQVICSTARGLEINVNAGTPEIDSNTDSLTLSSTFEIGSHNNTTRFIGRYKFCKIYRIAKPTSWLTEAV